MGYEMVTDTNSMKTADLGSHRFQLKTKSKKKENSLWVIYDLICFYKSGIFNSIVFSFLPKQKQDRILI